MSGNAEGSIVEGDLVEAIETGETGRVRAIYAVTIEGGPPMPDMIIITTDEATGNGIIRDRPSVRRKVVS
jgi:hypothetical protein